MNGVLENVVLFFPLLNPTDSGGHLALSSSITVRIQLAAWETFPSPLENICAQDNFSTCSPFC